MEPPALPAGAERLRVRFSKLGKVRFTSARDVARMWERALRRSGLPVAWSEGFSPHPLLSFGLALPTGCESVAEYLDIRLQVDGPATSAGQPADHQPADHKPADNQPVAAQVAVTATPPGRPAGAEPTPPEEAEDEKSLVTLADLLSSLLPVGVDVQRVALVPHAEGSLQQEVTSCSWELEVLGVTEGELAERVAAVLAAPSLHVRRVRKGKTVDDDLRPSVRTLELVVAHPEKIKDGHVPSNGSPHHVRAELATQPRGVRPVELLEGLGADLVLARACRTHQWIERDGARWEPLEGAPGGIVIAPHAQERAS